MQKRLAEAGANVVLTDLLEDVVKKAAVGLAKANEVKTTGIAYNVADPLFNIYSTTAKEPKKQRSTSGLTFRSGLPNRMIL